MFEPNRFKLSTRLLVGSLVGLIVVMLCGAIWAGQLPSSMWG